MPTVKDLARLNADQCGGDLYRQRLAMALGRGDYAAAETLGDRLVEQYPQFAAAWLAQGQARQAGKFEDAIKSYFEASQREPKHYEAIVGLAECYHQLNRPEEAKAVLAEGHQLFPTDPVLWDHYLNHLVNHGDPTQCVQDREHLVQENPKEFRRTGWRCPTPTSNRRQRRPGQRRRRVGLPDQGLCRAAGGATAVPGRRAVLRPAGGDARLRQPAGRRGEGAAGLRPARRRPRQARRLPAAGRLLPADGAARPGRAGVGNALVKADATELNTIRYRLAALMMQDHKYEPALAILDGVQPRGDPRATRQRIEVLIASGNMDQAKSEIDAALRQHNSADLRTLKASVLIDTGKVAEAMAELAAAAKLDPQYEMARYMHALALAKQPRPDVDGAVKELIELHHRNPPTCSTGCCWPSSTPVPDASTSPSASWRRGWRRTRSASPCG